ncbi:MAG: nitrilase-related carbon-nitrogen hydrolase, partial [Litorivicinus sp.]
SVSNDAWFGDSIARDQHLQMAQMRALELGLPMVRATNDGVTAVIDAQGRISARLENYAIGHLDDSFVPATTRTLYSLWGPWPVWGIAVALILANLVTASRRPTLPSKGRDR